MQESRLFGPGHPATAETLQHRDSTKILVLAALDPKPWYWLSQDLKSHAETYGLDFNHIFGLRAQEFRAPQSLSQGFGFRALGFRAIVQYFHVLFHSTIAQ